MRIPPRKFPLPALFLLSAPLLLSCGSPTGLNVDMERYDPIPQVEALDFAAVQPGAELPYWELRFSWGEAGEDSIIGSDGTLAREELPPETLEALEAITLPTGFAGGCLPGWCFKFIAAVDPEWEVVTHSTREALRSFLHPIDSRAEAVLLLDAHGFTWRDADQGIRTRSDDGWEAVVLELVRDCDPIQTDRVLVRVSPDGVVEVVQREVWERLSGACI